MSKVGTRQKHKSDELPRMRRLSGDSEIPKAIRRRVAQRLENHVNYEIRENSFVTRSGTQKEKLVLYNFVASLEYQDFGQPAPRIVRPRVAKSARHSISSPYIRCLLNSTNEVMANYPVARLEQFHNYPMLQPESKPASSGKTVAPQSSARHRQEPDGQRREPCRRSAQMSPRRLQNYHPHVATMLNTQNYIDFLNRQETASQSRRKSKSPKRRSKEEMAEAKTFIELQDDQQFEELDQQSDEQPNVQQGEKPNVQQDEQSNVQQGEQPNVQLDDQLEEEPNAQPGEQQSEQPDAQPVGQEEPDEQPVRQQSEQPDAQSVGQEEPDAQPDEQQNEQPDEQQNEQPDQQPFIRHDSEQTDKAEPPSSVDNSAEEAVVLSVSGSVAAVNLPNALNPDDAGGNPEQANPNQQDQQASQINGDLGKSPVASRLGKVSNSDSSSSVTLGESESTLGSDDETSSEMNTEDLVSSSDDNFASSRMPAAK